MHWKCHFLTRYIRLSTPSSHIHSDHHHYTTQQKQGNRCGWSHKPFLLLSRFLPSTLCSLSTNSRKAFTFTYFPEYVWIVFKNLCYCYKYLFKTIDTSTLLSSSIVWVHVHRIPPGTEHLKGSVNDLNTFLQHDRMREAITERNTVSGENTCIVCRAPLISADLDLGLHRPHTCKEQKQK